MGSRAPEGAVHRQALHRSSRNHLDDDALELGPDGIRVSVIEPGAVWTEWGHNVPDEAMRERRETVDALHAEDVAQALVYAFAQHPRVLVEEILIRPVKQIAP